jgi:regulator of replication initiation timing
MSESGNVEAMFNGLEILREGVTSLLREIEMLKAENEALKGRVMELQDRVMQAERYIESVTAASAMAVAEERRSAEPMGRVLPHDNAAAADAGHGKKKGGF